jgi:hypothetical protein
MGGCGDGHGDMENMGNWEFGMRGIRGMGKGSATSGGREIGVVAGQ